MRVKDFALGVTRASRWGVPFDDALRAATRNPVTGMSAEEFSRRMEVHKARAAALDEKCRAQDHVFIPFFDAYAAAVRAGLRIARWHITPEVHERLKAVGLAGDMILGYPVVVDR